MKTLHTLLPVALLAFYALCTTLNSFAQAAATKEDKKAAKQTRIQNLVASQQYVFKAQTMQPMSGRSRALTSDYDVKVGKDTLTCYLPYFGRAYTAPIGSTDGGIQFTSTNFSYSVAIKKKGGWDVLIKPNDAQDVQQLQLTISQDGYASLQVTSNNRQPISFNGYIDAKKEKK